MNEKGEQSATLVDLRYFSALLSRKVFLRFYLDAIIINALETREEFGGPY